MSPDPQPEIRYHGQVSAEELAAMIDGEITDMKYFRSQLRVNRTAQQK